MKRKLITVMLLACVIGILAGLSPLGAACGWPDDSLGYWANTYGCNSPETCEGPYSVCRYDTCVIPSWGFCGMCGKCEQLYPYCNNAHYTCCIGGW